LLDLLDGCFLFPLSLLLLFWGFGSFLCFLANSLIFLPAFGILSGFLLSLLLCLSSALLEGISDLDRRDVVRLEVAFKLALRRGNWCLQDMTLVCAGRGMHTARKSVRAD
jgi:hypothetical protein